MMMNKKKSEKKVSSACFVCLVLVLGWAFLQPPSARSQEWTTSGSNISNTNTGNVGIGTTSPGAKLDIFTGGTARVIAGDGCQGVGVYGGIGLGITSFNNCQNYSLASEGINLFVNAPSSSGVIRFRAGNNGNSGNDYMTLVGSTGNVGIGTSTPAYRLDVTGQINTSGGFCMAGDCKTSWSQVGGSSQWSNGTNAIYYSTGNVGIGTSTPSTKLNIFQNDANGSGLQIGNAASAGAHNYGGIYQLGSTGYGVADWPNATVIEGTANGGLVLSGYAAPIKFQTNSRITRMVIKENGYVGIGTSNPTKTLTVNGDIEVTGNINSKYQDVAEWVESSQKLTPGTVVILDSEKSNQVVAARGSYDTRVAGVISERPGIALGEGGENKVLVATTGRVKVKVDASRGAIKIGDLLVTSDVEGVAMKSEPVSLGGVMFHRPGTLIGKALEPLEKGRGEILVLLSLQ